MPLWLVLGVAVKEISIREEPERVLSNVTFNPVLAILFKCSISSTSHFVLQFDVQPADKEHLQ